MSTVSWHALHSALCCLESPLQVLQQQTAAAASAEVALLPHAAQRRLVRILRELDRHAIEKLLLWESYCKEEADPEASGGRDKGQRLRRLKLRVSAAIRQLNQQEVGRLPWTDQPWWMPLRIQLYHSHFHGICVHTCKRQHGHSVDCGA